MPALSYSTSSHRPYHPAAKLIGKQSDLHKHTTIYTPFTNELIIFRRETYLLNLFRCMEKIVEAGQRLIIFRRMERELPCMPLTLMTILFIFIPHINANK